MSDTTELQAAVERLRQYGDGLKRFPPYHEGDHCLQRDLRVVADAYLALGTRQPDEQRVYANGVQHDAEDIYDLIHRQVAEVKVLRVATFIQEIPEVPNAD